MKIIELLVKIANDEELQAINKQVEELGWNND